MGEYQRWMAEITYTDKTPSEVVAKNYFELHDIIERGPNCNSRPCPRAKSSEVMSSVQHESDLRGNRRSPVTMRGTYSIEEGFLFDGNLIPDLQQSLARDSVFQLFPNKPTIFRIGVMQITLAFAR